MNRYFNIFLLNLQDIFAHRSRSVVGFLITVINPLALLLFWKGAGKINSGFGQNYIVAYYLLLIIMGSLLRIDIEEEISEKDIYEGHLSQYLLRPFSYFWLKFFEDFPYRLLQGFYGLLVFFACLFFFGTITITHDVQTAFLAFIILVLGYMLAFTFKMIIGFIAFWIRETQAMYHVVDAIIVICAGYLLPFNVMPDIIGHTAILLPFAYMAYFPVIAFQGKLTVPAQLQVIATEIIWLAVFFVLYRIVWSRGLKKYTALGQ